MKFYKWTVEFEVSSTWVEDGFDLTDDRALSMLAHDLRYARGDELRARVTQAPSAKDIRREQGYTDDTKRK